MDVRPLDKLPDAYNRKVVILVNLIQKPNRDAKPFLDSTAWIFTQYINLTSHVKSSVMMFSFPPVILVFKTAVVFVCKEGSKQKKKMVSEEPLATLFCYSIIKKQRQG